MKDLSTYIIESKRLSDLKGKRVGKIEVGSTNLEWNRTSDVVNIKDPKKLTKEDIIEIYYTLERIEHLDIEFDFKHRVTKNMLHMTIRFDYNGKDKGFTMYKFADNFYLGDATIKTDFVDYVYLYISSLL